MAEMELENKVQRGPEQGPPVPVVEGGRLKVRRLRGERAGAAARLRLIHSHMGFQKQ